MQPTSGTPRKSKSFFFFTCAPLLLAGCLQINAPQKNEIITGTYTVTAVETDSNEVYQNDTAHFYIDGVEKATDTGNPYQWAWDTRTVGDGAHTITVKAFSVPQQKWLDASVSVSVNNTTAPNDTSPPTTPSVTDEGATTTAKHQLTASWSASDPQGGVAEYQVGIGTTPTSPNVKNWFSVGVQTTATISGLNLNFGQTYYILVKARNPVYLWSNVGASNGISIVAGSPPSISAVNIISAANFHNSGALTIQVQAADPDGAVLLYQFSVNGTVIKPWQAAAQTAWQPPANAFGLQTILAEVKDVSDATAQQTNATYIFDTPPHP